MEGALAAAFPVPQWSTCWTVYADLVDSGSWEELVVGVMSLDERERERPQIETSAQRSERKVLVMPMQIGSCDFVTAAGERIGMVQDRSVFACCWGGEESDWLGMGLKWATSSWMKDLIRHLRVENWTLQFARRSS